MVERRPLLSLEAGKENTFSYGKRLTEDIKWIKPWAGECKKIHTSNMMSHLLKLRFLQLKVKHIVTTLLILNCRIYAQELN